MISRGGTFWRRAPPTPPSVRHAGGLRARGRKGAVREGLALRRSGSDGAGEGRLNTRSYSPLRESTLREILQC